MLRCLEQRERGSVAESCALLSDPSQQVRSAAIEALAEAQDHEAARQIAELRADPAVRVAAIKALGQLKGEVAFQALLGALESKEPFVRMRAVDALAALTDRRALPQVTAIYRASAPADWDAASFAKAFAVMGNRRLALQSASVAMQSQHPNARLRTIEVLANIQSPEVVPLLMNDLVPSFRSAMLGRDVEASQRFKLIWQQLERLTDQHYGEDLVQWLQWWEGACSTYKATKLDISIDEAAKLMKEMQLIRAAKM